MIAFTNAHPYFKKYNIDSNSSHLAWVYDIYCRTGIRVSFPIIADRNGEIARKYGMISNNISNTETVRNVFIIDPNGIIRVILVYPMNVGRFIPEILRIVQALQTADNNNASTAANWLPYQPVIIPMPKNFTELEKRKNAYQTRLYEAVMDTLNISEIKILEDSVENIKYNIKLQLIVIANQQKNVDRAREKLDNAMKERKTYEKLKEKAFEEFKEQINAEEQKEINELVSFKFRTGSDESED